jgi:hypothetical protein
VLINYVCIIFAPNLRLDSGHYTMVAAFVQGTHRLHPSGSHPDHPHAVHGCASDGRWPKDQVNAFDLFQRSLKTSVLFIYLIIYIYIYIYLWGGLYQSTQ